MRSILKASVLAATLGGCVASAGVGYHATVVAPAPVATVNVEPAPVATVNVEPAPVATVQVDEQPVAEVEYQEPASYVYVNPNVQVIEDYDYPVFYSNNLYWRNEGGVWYSSSYHDRGWVTGVEAPVYIRTIERPEHFVHYHADVHASVGQPGYRYHPTAPIRHTAPPPRYVEHPGRPVRAPEHARTGPVEPHHEALHPQPPPQHVQPQTMHPQPPPASKPDVRPTAVQPATVKAPPPPPPSQHPSSPPPKKKK